MKKILNLVIVVLAVIFTAFPMASTTVEANKIVAEAKAEAAAVADEIESAIATNSTVHIDNDIDHFEFFHSDWDKSLVENWYYVPNHKSRFVMCDENHDYGVVDYSNNGFVSVTIPKEIVAEAEEEASLIIADGNVATAIRMVISASLYIAFLIISSHIEERKEDKRHAAAMEAAREAREAAVKAEAESLIVEAVEALTFIEDNGLIVFNTYSLERAVQRCYSYISRDNINNLREALSNLVYYK